MYKTLLQTNMQKAIKLAKTSGCDLPVGCIILDKNNNIITQTTNEVEKNNNVTHHAEILAINEAATKLNTKYLNDCKMYVTLEPCPMCAWSIILAKIDTVYFGAYDLNYGAFLSKYDLRKSVNSKLKVYGGICEDECISLIKDYFKSLRV